MSNLDRFIRQEYLTALSELENGLKVTHWMWFIFPQLKGLGYTEECKKYEFKNTREAELFLKSSEHRERLITAFKTILKHSADKDLTDIFSEVDVLKYISCATLFLMVAKSLNDETVIDVTQKSLDWANREYLPMCEYTVNKYKEDKLLEQHYLDIGITSDEDSENDWEMGLFNAHRHGEIAELMIQKGAD